MKKNNLIYCNPDFPQKSLFASLVPLSPQKLIVYALILSVSIDTTSFFSFHFGALQISTPDILLLALLYVIVAESAIGSFKISAYSSKIALMLVAAGAFSLVSFFYMGGGRYAILDAKISLKFFEHAALIFAVGSAITDVKTLRLSLRIFCISSAVLSVLTIMQSLGILHLGAGFTRKTTFELGPFLIGTAGLSGEVMGISLLILATFPFMVSRFVFQSILLRLLFIILTLLAVTIIFTRSTWISIAIEIALIFLVYINGLKFNSIKIVSYTLVLLLITIFCINFEKLYSFLIDMRSSTVEGRINGYISALSLVFSNPFYVLFGAGKGNFLLNQFYIGRSAFAHNFLIDIFVSKGIVVLSIVLYTIGNLFINLYRIAGDDFQSLKFLSLISISGVVVGSMFMPSINSIQLWLLVAIICSIISLSSLYEYR